MKLSKAEVKALNELPEHQREFVVEWIKNDRTATFYFDRLIRAENKMLEALKSLIIYDDDFNLDTNLTRRHYNMLKERSKNAHKVMMRNDRRNVHIANLPDELYDALIHVASAERRAKTVDRGKYGK